MRKIFQYAAIAIGTCGVAFAVDAQTTGGTGSTSTGTTLTSQIATMDKLATSKGQMHVANKTASSFVTLAGSQANALALVNGLRNGTAITLAAPTTGTGTTTGGTTGTTTGTTTGGTTGTGTPVATGTPITPPTGKMGWGNVFISLALAQKVLTQAGIASPTAAQLQTALLGGDLVGADGKTVAVKGVLQLRADGMGWGKIAQVYGTKLGPVVSELKSANKHIANAPAATGTSATSTATGTSSTTRAATNGKTTLPTGKGLTTAGSATGTSGAKGLVTAGGGAPSGKGAGIVTAGGNGNGHGHALGKGVVNAAGGNAANAASATRGGGAGLVTGSGAAASNAATGLTTAQGHAGQGHGNGNANGKGKGG